MVCQSAGLGYEAVDAAASRGGLRASAPHTDWMISAPASSNSEIAYSAFLFIGGLSLSDRETADQEVLGM